MTKADKIANYDPNGVGATNSGIFGLPFTPEESNYMILPVPFELTTSYGGGTSRGPKAIFEASPQIDLYHPFYGDVWKEGIAMLDIDKELNAINRELLPLSAQYIQQIEEGLEGDSSILAQINEASEEMNDLVYKEAKYFLNEGKHLIMIGGEHACSLGYLKAIKEQYPDVGVLQIDAHMDLRKAYEGFTYSHASVMYNAITELGLKHLVQVGIRDCCDEEVAFAEEHNVAVFYDRDIQSSLFEGKTWQYVIDQIIDALPEHIYISFDIDGLDPQLCPNTGTPVPGGLSFQQMTYLLEQVAKSGKKIVGADLVEVSPGTNDWDANVGARVLYQLIGNMFVSLN